jgi:Ca2+-binding EF-hand superfamily protein
MLHCGLLLAACSSAILGAGCAGKPPELSDTIEGRFIRAVQTWDLNHDGKVTCEEWRTYAVSLFKEADSDHNGKLTREEFAKLPKIDRLFEVANFDYYDVNKQGYVTQADFVDRPNPAFAALHHDKSCVINSDQLRGRLRASEEAIAKPERKPPSDDYESRPLCETCQNTCSFGNTKPDEMCVAHCKYRCR